MFTRIGKKIKTVATVLFYVLAVAFVIGAFYVIINFGQLLGIGNAILIGILIALVGCLVAWLSSLMLYGFGELVDNSTIIKDALAGGVTAEQTDHKSSPFHGLAKAVNGVRTPRHAVFRRSTARTPKSGMCPTRSLNLFTAAADHAGICDSTQFLRAGRVLSPFPASARQPDRQFRLDPGGRAEYPVPQLPLYPERCAGQGLRLLPAMPYAVQSVNRFYECPCRPECVFPLRTVF